jgi:peptidyl-prolyl cis-trans isomerase B (cyclophilin B)
VASGVSGGTSDTGRSYAAVRRDHLRFAAVREQQFDRRWIILGVFALVAVVIVAVILISRSGGGSSDSTTSGTVGNNGCEKVEAPEPRKESLPAPKQTVQKGEKLTAVVETSCGDFDIALDTTRAPKTANSFAYLAEEGFYEDLTFHRIVPEFVIQGGDPEGTGAGGPGYKVTEKPPSNLAYTKGIVAMAKSPTEPPGTSGSQFFVVTGADAGLPPEYALVGKVSSGMDVVETIGKLGTPEEKPKQTVLIKSIKIEHG